MKLFHLIGSPMFLFVFVLILVSLLRFYDFNNFCDLSSYSYSSTLLL